MSSHDGSATYPGSQARSSAPFKISSLPASNFFPSAVT